MPERNFSIYLFIDYETFWTMGKAVVAAATPQDARTSLASYLTDANNKLRREKDNMKDITDIHFQMRGPVIQTKFTSNENGVLYASSACGYPPDGREAILE